MCDKRRSNFFIKSEKFYVRLENLPWSACHGDILEFFEDISIPHGGVTIRNEDVIVALQTSNDLDRVLIKTGERINGNKIYISKLSPSQLRQRYRQNIRRVLNFTPVPQRQVLSIKRIRPTCKLVNESEMFNIFNPEENDIHQTELIAQKNVMLPHKTKRKIKPTHLEDILNNREFFIDEFNYCSRKYAKRLKIDENMHTTPIIAVT